MKAKKGAIAVGEDKISIYNDDENQNGIYFTPNGDFGIAEGYKRTAGNAQSIYCFMIDRDDDADFKVKFWEAFPYQPSFVIETKRGYHAYRLLDKAVMYNTHGKQRSEVQNYLVATLNGDPQAKDIARLMRLPGTIHRKDGEKGPVTECIIYEPTRKYRFEQFMALVEAESKIKKLKTFKKEYEKGNNDAQNSFDRIEKDVDVAELLYKLSNGKREAKKDGAIREDGQNTDGYRWNKSGNYINNFSDNHPDRPSGGPFAVAKLLLGGIRETYRYFRENYGIGETKLVTFREEPVKKNDTEIPEVVDGNMSWTIDTSNSHIKGDYVSKKVTREDNKGNEIEILSAYIRPIGYYKNDKDVNVYIIEYEKENGMKGILYGKYLNALNDFVKLMGSVGITFFGNKVDHQHIVAYIQNTENYLEYINKVGIYSKDKIINKPGRYVHDNKYFVDIIDYDPVDKRRGEIFSIGEDAPSEEVRQMIIDMESIYAPHIIHTLFMAHAMSLFSMHIRSNFPQLPMVVSVGLTQSGKTSLRKYFMEMFGYDNCVETQASATEFSIMRRIGHFVPTYICEFENEALRFDFDTFVKNVFDGTATTRGTANQELIQYPTHGMIFVDGESRSMTPSVYTRSIMLFMNPRYMVQSDKSLKLLNNVKNISGYFVQKYDMFEKLFTKDAVAKWKEYLDQEYKNRVSMEKGRILTIYAMMLCFAEIFGLVDLVHKSILKQIDSQFSMQGEDKLDQDIKNIFGIAIANKMPVTFTKENILIEFSLDSMRVDKKRLSDIRSSIQLVNHHFGNGESTDHMIVPLNHIFKNKGLHVSFNRYVDNMDRYHHIDFGKAREPMKIYCEENGYRDANFYETLKNQF